MKIKLNDDWATVLQNEIKANYFKKLFKFLEKEYTKSTIYPAFDNIFNAFNLTSFNNVKVVLLGQDPYHRKGQAHGLSFSVPQGMKLPPSLKNIFKEMYTDLGYAISDSGNLEPWAMQGVLLLNATLTVEEKKAGSHQKMGWETFTDAVIQTISENKSNLVFMLWGNFAQSKIPLIDESKHCILTAAHPSPFSAYNGFFGCRHFSKANEYLTQKGLHTINWKLQNGTLWE